MEQQGVEAQSVDAQGVDARGIQAQDVETQGAEAKDVKAQGTKTQDTKTQGTKDQGTKAQGIKAEPTQIQEVKAQAIDAQVGQSEATVARPPQTLMGLKHAREPESIPLGPEGEEPMEEDGPLQNFEGFCPRPPQLGATSGSAGGCLQARKRMKEEAETDEKNLDKKLEEHLASVSAHLKQSADLLWVHYVTALFSRPGAGDRSVEVLRRLEEVRKRLMREQNSSSIKERKESKVTFALSNEAMLADDA